MCKDIVSRLSCGAEVQQLCSTSVQCFDSKFSDLFFSNSAEKKDASTCSIRFEECLPTSVVIVLQYNDKLLKNFLGCRLWHRGSTMDYPEQPSIVLRPEKIFKLENLHPSTEYFCKASLFNSTGISGAAEAEWATPCELKNSPSEVTRYDRDHSRRSPRRSSVTGMNIWEQDKIKVRAENQKVEYANSVMKLSSRNHPAKHISFNKIRGRFEEFLNKPPSVEPFSHSFFFSMVSPSKSNEMRQIAGLSSRKCLKENDYENSVR